MIHDEPDGLNINLDCGSTHIQSLQQFVLANHLDIGFAFDGDADRCIAVDEQGNEVNGDLIMYLCARYMKERGTLRNNTVVTTVTVSYTHLDVYKRQPAGDLEWRFLPDTARIFDR